MTPSPLPARTSAKHLLGLVAAGLIATACSSSSGGSAAGTAASPAAAAPTTSAPAASAPGALAPAVPSTPAAAAASTITIKNFAYDVPASVPAGANVMIVNKDGEAHTVTLGGDAKVKVVVQGGSTGMLTAPAKAGNYPITCDFHGNMHGRLVVA